MRLVVFEDEWCSAFGPLTALRHTSQLTWGTKTLLESAYENTTGATDLRVWGRKAVGEVTYEAVGEEYNQAAEGWALFVNARARPDGSLQALTARKSPFVAVADGQLVAARLDGSMLDPGLITRKDVAKLTKKVDSFDVPTDRLFKGYWELVESNGRAIADQAGHSEDSLPPSSTAGLRGPPSNLHISAGADVESHVTFDARLGPIVVEDGVSVESFSRIMGPCFLGRRAKLYSALIGGGTSIFGGCRIGGQVENSIVMSNTNKAHHGYLGDSYVGEWVNLGAGSTVSNLKNTYGNVRVEVEGKRVDSGMLKLGPCIGDMCKISIGGMVYAGRSVGTGSHVAGLASSSVPSFTYFDGNARKLVELRIDSVLETQRRMMERRDKTLSRAGEALIREAFRETAGERRKAGVRKGKIS